MDRYPIRLLGSSGIATIWQNLTLGHIARFMPDQKGASYCVNISQSANAACRLCDRCWAESLCTAWASGAITRA